MNPHDHRQALNPEAQGRMRMVHKLRRMADELQHADETGEKIPVRGMSIDIRQAANEIEDFDELKRNAVDARKVRIFVRVAGVEVALATLAQVLPEAPASEIGLLERILFTTFLPSAVKPMSLEFGLEVDE